MSSPTKRQPPPTAARVTEARLRAGVGARVREARERAGLTGRKLAQLAGVTPGFISQVERGQVTPSLLSLLRITQTLGIKMADVFDAREPVVGRAFGPD